MIFERAEAYYAAGRYPEALMTYKEYQQLYPETYRGNDASFRMAQCLEALGDRVEAAEQYRKTGLVYSKCDLAPAAFLRAGELYELEGCIHDARWCYEKATDWAPKEESMLAAKRLFDLDARAGGMAHRPRSILGRLLRFPEPQAHPSGVAHSEEADETDSPGIEASLFTGIAGGPSIDPFAPDQPGEVGTSAVTRGSSGSGGRVTTTGGPTPRRATPTPPPGITPGDVISVFFGEPTDQPPPPRAGT